MFSKLKKRLVLLYGTTTSIILTLIIIGVYIISYNQSQEQTRILFQKNVEQVADRIQSKGIINSIWLAQMQRDNHMLIILEDNGKRLTSFSDASPTINIDKSVVKLKELAKEQGILLDTKPILKATEKTSIYTFHKNILQSYLGMAISIRSDNGWQTVIAFYSDNNQWNTLQKQLLSFALIELAGVAALFLISFLYIDRVLQPLEEGQQKQNAFVAAASHELRTPLTIVKAAVTSLREDNAKVDQFLPYIEGECNRMTRLISDMLLLASADAKTWSLQKEKMDLDTLLIESYDMFCSCRKPYDIDLTLELTEGESHMVMGDKERISQVVAILIDNAMSYGKEGKTVALRVYNWKSYAIVEVMDHGCGISSEEKKLIFDRFYQGNKSRTEKKHFGLGLSVAKELVELHGGDITVKDTPGGGSTFVFRLPRLNG